MAPESESDFGFLDEVSNDLRFARYAYQLAVGAPPEPDNEVMGLFQSSNPTMNRPPAPSRQRDLLPPPRASLAAEDLPREVSHTENMKTRKRAVALSAHRR